MPWNLAIAVPIPEIIPTIRDLPQTNRRRALDAILNLIYPEGCLLCGAPVWRSRDCSVCEACWQRILGLRITPPWCPSCGMPYQQSVGTDTHLCGDCILRPPDFAGARSFGLYTAEMRGVIQALKFHGRRNLALLLAPLMALTCAETWRPGEIHMIVPIPLHPRRQRVRGYNQAALLGKQVGKILGVPCGVRTLARVRHTSPQVGLSTHARLANLRHAFHCPLPVSVNGLSLLLVDDVMTTGATAGSAARALRQAGAARVSVLTAARTLTRSE